MCLETQRAHVKMKAETGVMESQKLLANHKKLKERHGIAFLIALRWNQPLLTPYLRLLAYRTKTINFYYLSLSVFDFYRSHSKLTVSFNITKSYTFFSYLKVWIYSLLSKIKAKIKQTGPNQTISFCTSKENHHIMKRQTWNGRKYLEMMPYMRA